MRKTEFDIMRGLLIIAVVMGHAGVKLPYVDMQWFRMPAFFIVSGYFTKGLYAEKDLLAYKAKRLVVPWLSYSVLMYCLLQPEPLLKNIARTIYAGSFNTTIYSFPWWFVNALMVSLIGFSLLRKVNGGGQWTMLLFYILIHIEPLWDARPIPLPWSIDNAFGAMVFIYIGYRMRGYSLRRRDLWIALVPVAFVIANEYFGWHYHINMKGMTYTNILLDLIVPCSFTFLVYVVSLLLSKVKVIGPMLAHIGICCMTIFYVHAAVLHFVKPYSPVGAVIFSVFVGVAIDALWRTNPTTRRLFIGEMKKKTGSVPVPAQ